MGSLLSRKLDLSVMLMKTLFFKSVRATQYLSRGCEKDIKLRMVMEKEVFANRKIFFFCKPINKELRKSLS